MAINACGICYKEIPDSFIVSVSGPIHPDPHYFHYACIISVLKNQQAVGQAYTCPCSSRITQINEIPNEIVSNLFEELGWNGHIP